MSGSILFEAIIFLAGAVIFVPIAKRLGLSSVLGYLLAGMVIGPYMLGFIGQEGEDILHFAEFGVVIMLFLIGLEIEPSSFWKMRKSIVGLGGGQVFLTILLTHLGFTFLGFDWKVALVFAMAVSLSSTAIVLQTIKEKNMFHTSSGSASFSILLFQDIIVIPMLAVIPLLANEQGLAEQAHGDEIKGYLLHGLPLALQTLTVIGSVAVVILAGKYLVVPMLRVVATAKSRELLSASALLIVLGLSLVMELVGLSPALGAFLGGVVLATSEFKHELESNLEPFKGLLLGLFFMAVGGSINFILIRENPLQIAIWVMGIVLMKSFVLYVVSLVFGMKMDQRLLLGVNLAQVGEFAFVVLSFAFQLNILNQEQLDMMLVITALSMTTTPIISVLNERIVLPRIGTRESEEKDDRPMDKIENQHKIIVVGFGHFGSTVVRFLRSHGIGVTVLDIDSNRVDLLRKMGFEVYYGDATRMDLLESAGIANADLFVSAVDNPDTTLKLVKMVHEKYPNLKMMVRALGRNDAYEILNMGIEDVYRENLDTAVKMAGDILAMTGFRKYTVHRQMQNFIKYDEESLRRLAKKPNNSEEYIFKTKEEIAQQERLMEEDRRRGTIDKDLDWDSEQMRVNQKRKL